MIEVKLLWMAVFYIVPFLIVWFTFVWSFQQMKKQGKQISNRTVLRSIIFSILPIVNIIYALKMLGYMIEEIDKKIRKTEIVKSFSRWLDSPF